MSRRRLFRLFVLFGLLLALAPAASAVAQPPMLEWIRSVTLPYGGSVAAGVGVDVTGAIYVAGTITDANGGYGFNRLDAVVYKYDAVGSLLWTRQFGTSTADWATGIAVDRAGNVYVSGYTYDDSSLAGAPDGEEGGGFVREYYQDGSLGWTHVVDREIDAVAVDPFGNVYAAGIASQDGGGFVRLYHASGSVGWTQHFGSTDATHVSALAVDVSGNVYVAGAENSSGFVRQYHSDGSEGWTNSGDGTINDLAIDASENVYAASSSAVYQYHSNGSQGWTSEASSQGLSVDGVGNLYGTRTIVQPGGYPPHVVVRQYHSDGSLGWAQQFDIVHCSATGEGSSTGVAGIAADVSGNLYVTGSAGCSSEWAFVAKLSAPSASQMVSDLTTLVRSFHLKQGTEQSLTAKLANVQSALAGGGGRQTSACNQLTAFTNEVAAQSGKGLTPSQAAGLTAGATAIRDALGCR